MLQTIHIICSYPGCGHTALTKKPFDWPVEPAPDAEIPAGWSVVLRRAGEAIVIIAVCENHEFQFSDVKSRELRQVGFEIPRADEDA